MLENELPEGVADVLNKRGTDSVREVLEERGKVHGKISENSKVSQELYRSVLEGWLRCKQAGMTPVENECLHMICHKLARFVTGDHEHRDHMDDVAGYATLLADHIEKEKWGGSDD